MNTTRAAIFFDEYAEGFDNIYGTSNSLWNRMVNKYFRKCMHIRYEKTMTGCQPVEGKRVLDIGCGPGRYSVKLAQMGAAHVYGIDFATAMIDLATQRAQRLGVGDRCFFEQRDFFSIEPDAPFDYAIVMGVMDYVADPQALIDQACHMTTSRAFFSFPIDGGLLSWQRKLRYKKRCDLFMYNREQVQKLFENAPCKRFDLELNDRDFFVTVHRS